METSAGLVLIDTGFGLRDVAEPRARVDLRAPTPR
ncbi:hypothetical protein IM53_002530 [Xanthomonas phaseoli pv. dieffenbachiae]|uniref:Uncharacterized protein n=1 Tax=Xanthomonas phaseoli pv. dieffenbachiae TaxID=92828 RepID=A0A1V9HGF0_9XANT|nr:hypothetical protein IM53_002530 [Xanthomonas phaseoli pv. dieffenbachiae]